MRAPTHGVFGIFVMLGLACLFGAKFDPAVALFVIFGSLLPDIDTESSLIGRAGFPISRVLERQFGHRTITHSLLGCAVAGMVFSPLWWVNRNWYTGFMVGYASHITVDQLNQSGVCFYFPDMSRAVIPGRDDWRIEVGSGKEYIFLAAVGLLCVWLVYLVSIGGIAKYLHRLFAQPKFAVQDYLSWCSQYQVYARCVLVDTKTNKEFKGRVKLIGNIGERVLVGRIGSKTYAIGTASDVNLYARRIVCEKGERVRVIERKVDLSDRFLGEICKLIDTEKEHYLFGRLDLYEGVSFVSEVNSFRTVSVSSPRRLTLNYATWEDIRRYGLEGVYVHRGEVLVRTVRKLEVGDWRLEVGEKREAGCWKMEVGGWRLERRGKLDAGRRKLEVGCNRMKTGKRENEKTEKCQKLEVGSWKLDKTEPSEGEEKRIGRRVVYTINRVKELRVRRGDRVRQGQVIAEVYDNVPSKMDIRILQAKLRSARRLREIRLREIKADILALIEANRDLEMHLLRLKGNRSVFEDVREDISRIREKIRANEGKIKRLRLRRQEEKERRDLEIIKLEHDIDEAKMEGRTRYIRARSEGVVTTVSKRVVDDTVIVVVSVVGE